MVDKFDELAEQKLPCTCGHEYSEKYHGDGTKTPHPKWSDSCPAYHRPMFAAALRETAEREWHEGYEAGLMVREGAP